MLACCATGRRRLDELALRFGSDAVQHCVDALFERSEMRMRRAISAIPPGTYRYEDYLDSDRDTGNPILLTVAITKSKDSLEADFTGSASQVSAPTNGSLAVTAMGTFVALKALLDPQGPINQGAFRPVSVWAPEGTILNVQPPGAVGGYTEIRRRVESVVTGALAQAVPQYVAGDIKGTSNHTYIGSSHPTRGETIFYEYPAGGTGGFLEHDGGDAMRAYDEGDFSSIQPVEAVELEHALLVESCSLRPDSCGDGRHRGGLGLRREIRLLAHQGLFSELSDRNIVPPFGVCGGYAAAPNQFSVRRDGKTIAPSAVPGKVSGFALRADDVVVIETAGGGGYGSPLERDPELVARDVREGYISRRRARASYGVSLRRGRVDVVATARERESLSKAVAHLQVIATEESGLEDGRRICRLNPEDAMPLGGRGALIEVVNPAGAPLRMWLAESAATAVGRIPLDAVARGILGTGEAAVVEVRPLRAGKREGGGSAAHVRAR
jgi:N-methylhydantoinase B